MSNSNVVRRHIAVRPVSYIFMMLAFLMFSTFSTIASAEVFTTFHIGTVSQGLAHSQYECFQDLGATCATSGSNQGVICSDYGSFQSSSSSFSGLGQYVACMGSVCPEGSSEGAENDRCICDGGAELNNDGTCPAPVCTADEVLSTGIYDVGTQQNTFPPPVACFSSCTAIFIGDGPYPYLDNGTKNYAFVGDYISDGTNCSDGSGDELNPLALFPENDCGLNAATVTLNGTTTCVTAEGYSDPVPNVSDSINESIEGTTLTIEQTIDTDTVDNGDGTSTTTITTTTINNDGTTTTTITNNTTDNTTSETLATDTTTTNTVSGDADPLAAFCEDNPNNALCGTTSVTGGGTCASPPVCTGDAIQCSIDHNLWEINCTLESTHTESNDCVTPPVCTGDAIQCAIDKNIWKQNCALEAISTITQEETDQSLSDVTQWISESIAIDGSFADLQEGGSAVVETDLATIVDIDSFDTEAGQCPDMPTVTYKGSEISMSPLIEPLCNLAGVFAFLSYFIVFFIHVAAIYRGFS